jgi:hypothetical protein
VRAGLEQGGRQLSARLQQMLAIVQHHQELSPLQGHYQRFGDGAPSLFPRSQCGGCGLGHKRRVCQRSQLYQPDPIRVLLQQLGRDPQGETGLTTPTGPRQRNQARRAGQPLLQLGDLGFATDKTAEREGQVMSRQRSLARKGAGVLGIRGAFAFTGPRSSEARRPFLARLGPDLLVAQPRLRIRLRVQLLVQPQP